MTSAVDLAAVIAQLLPDVKRGSLVVFGDVFGGRIDNIHTVTSAKAPGDPERLVIGFDEGETLEVWDPGNAMINSSDFCISTANRVRWEWFYYGRPKTSGNRLFIEHVRTNEVVVAKTNAPFGNRAFAPTVERAAVELLGMF